VNTENLARLQNKHGGRYARKKCDDSVWNDFHRKFTGEKKEKGLGEVVEMVGM